VADLDLARLRELAEAAPKGSWHVVSSSDCERCRTWDATVMASHMGADPIAEADQQTAAYLAALSPEVVLALLDRVKVAELNTNLDCVDTCPCVSCRQFREDQA